MRPQPNSNCTCSFSVYLMQQRQQHGRFSRRRVTDVGEPCLLLTSQETHAPLAHSLAPFSYLCATSFSPPPPHLSPPSLPRPVVRHAPSGRKARQSSPLFPPLGPTLFNPTGSNLSVNLTALTPLPQLLSPRIAFHRPLCFAPSRARLSQWIPGFLV